MREILFPMRHPITLEASASVADSKASIILLPVLGPQGGSTTAALDRFHLVYWCLRCRLAFSILVRSKKKCKFLSRFGGVGMAD